MRSMVSAGWMVIAVIVAACATPPASPASPASSLVPELTPNAAAAPGPQTAPAAPSTQPTEVATMEPTAFTLSSTAFSEGGVIPRRFTCDGENGSPDLSWSGAPEDTKALTLVMIDPDARDFVHWIVFDMTGTPTGGLPTGISSSPDAPPQGTNSFGSPGYGGPCPPSGEHHYAFTLYALAAPLELSGAPRLGEVQAAMADRVLATTTLTATYHR